MPQWTRNFSRSSAAVPGGSPGATVVRPKPRRTPPADVPPRDVRAWFDRAQLVVAVVAGDETAEAVEVRIERRIVAAGVDLVRIAAVRVGVPHFDERPANGTQIFVENPAGDD